MIIFDKFDKFDFDKFDKIDFDKFDKIGNLK